MKNLYSGLKKLGATLVLVYSSLRTPREVVIDTGYARQDIDSHNDPIRTVKRAPNSDIVFVSERDSNGNWTTRREVLEKIV